MDELCFASAGHLASLIRTRELSARELMVAQLRQIERLNARLNAIVAKLDDATCLGLADAADRRAAAGLPLGPLHGLPTAFKDLEPAVGFPCSLGSPLFRGDYPAVDSVLVERLRIAGVVPIGKTNVPEFGMGSQSYNRVYGTTVNPYDLSKTAGGSSGGAAASVAAGLLPFADGSDLGGSLRNPGSFNNVVGFRPSVGLVPNAPLQLPFLGFTVKGPIARSVADAALVLSAMAGADPRDPACYPSDPATFAGALAREFRGVRVAWRPDLGGLLLETMRRFQESYPFLLCAVSQLPPFDASLDWPTAIEGVNMPHYIAWMQSAYWITATFRPAISVPAGFTPEGLPVGL